MIVRSGRSAGRRILVAALAGVMAKAAAGMTVPPMPSRWCFPLAPAVLLADYRGSRGAAGHVRPGWDNRPVEPLVVGGVAWMRPGPDADHESRSAGHRRGIDGVRPGGVGPSVDPQRWPAPPPLSPTRTETIRPPVLTHPRRGFPSTAPEKGSGSDGPIPERTRSVSSGSARSRARER